MQIAVLNDLWNTTKQEAEDIVNTLWGYILIKFTATTPAIKNHTTLCGGSCCHSQYIIECMDSSEFPSLSPFGKDLNTKITIKMD